MSTRRLAALMFTDMVGYSATAHANEILARSLVSEQRAIVRSSLAKHSGREHDTTGDGFFIEFASAVDALKCAVDIQSQLFDRNRSVSQERQIVLRIGLHLGDIVSEGADLFGNGVNLAARIEPLAPLGGICLTQQMYDQVHGKIAGLSFKKQGHRKLKNIASGAVVYSVIAPWNNSEKGSRGQLTAAKKAVFKLPFFENINSVASAGLFVLCLMCLVISSYRAYVYEPGATLTQTSRNPASVERVSTTQPRLDLSKDWTYQVAGDGRLSVSKQTPLATGWRPFDPINSWKHSEELKGPYWLKKQFELPQPLETPAIVLGQISGPHRVYLNGKFVGGAENSSELAFYTFSPDLLGTTHANELIVSVDGRPSLNPGLNVISSVGSFLGDFREVRDAVQKNQVKFGILRNVYFAISVFIFFIALAYSVFRRSSKAYFYYAFVLLLGSIELAYFNPLMNIAFDYPFLRYLRVLSLTLTPVVLFSAFLSTDASRKWLRFEALNNVFAAFIALVSGVVLFHFSPTAVQFSEHYNLLLAAGMAYSIAAVLIAATSVIKNASIKGSGKGSGRERLIVALFYCAFELAAFLGLASSLKRGVYTNLLSGATRDWLVQFTMATPFVFALAVMAVATLDYIRQSATAQFQKRRDDFTREILHLIHDSHCPSATTQLVHEKLSSFMQSTRSTLYVVDEQGQTSSLRLVSCIGRQLSTGDLSASSLKSHRILSHVLNTRTPVLIRNIRSDLRFFDKQQGQQDRPSSYRTGSCMVIPLRSLGKCVGLLTFADKADDNSFTDSDFSTALEMASTLALLVNSSEPVKVAPLLQVI